MKIQRSVAGILSLLVVMIFTTCAEEEEEAVGALVGKWQLTALSADYVRDVPTSVNVDIPEGGYILSASWDVALTFFQDDIAAAATDQVLAAFNAGDPVFTIKKDFDAAALAVAGISLAAEFLEDSTYSLTGTYPALRIVTALCSTYLAIPQISDVGNYTIAYNAAETGGTLGITPDETLGDAVLPTYNDGVVAFSNNGNTLQLDFVDRDGHDTRIAETGEQWNEEKHRVTMGVAVAPKLKANNVFVPSALADTTGNTGYIMDPALAPWGNYLTLYALVVQAEFKYLLTPGSPGQITTDYTGDGTIDEDDAVAYMGLVNPSGISQLQLPYLVLVAVTDGVPGLVNDSVRDFDPTSGTTQAAGGKLTYVINSVCVPANEIIGFESTWDKITP